MTPLVLGLGLALTTTPAQPPLPAYPQPLPPGVRQFPQFPGGPVYRPGFPPAIVVPPPVAYPPPANPGPLPPAVGALTLDQFSRVFAPTPGQHHYWIVHPRTCRPVEVCFVLPNCGRLDRVRVNRSSIHIDIDNPDYDVDIDFRNDGTVRIRYSD
ncbi:hypothetical protein J0H58_14895 [bacterium]|nr:hypothetical protein [bacterium]